VLIGRDAAGTDGVEVCRQLKANPALRDIPVLMVTARGEESDIVLGLAIGADDYIPKPFQPARAVARSSGPAARPLRDSAAAQATLARGSLTINTTRTNVMLKGAPVSVDPL